MPPTLLHHTGGGGLHRVYAYPEGLDRLPTRTGHSAVAPGLELLADGGAAVLPPSRHALGGFYEVLIARSSPPCPLGSWTSPRVLPWSRAATIGRRRAGSRCRLHPGGQPQPHRPPLRVLVARPRPRPRRHPRRATPRQRREVPPAPRRRGGEEDRPLGRETRARERGDAGLLRGPRSPPRNRGRAVLGAVWPRVGGKSERSVMIALILAARRHGTLIPAGVRVSLDTPHAGGDGRDAPPHADAGRAPPAPLGYPPQGRRGPRSLRVRRLCSRLRRHRVPRTCTPRMVSPLNHPPTAYRDGGGSSAEGWENGDGLRAPRLRWGFSLGKTADGAGRAGASGREDGAGGSGGGCGDQQGQGLQEAHRKETGRRGFGEGAGCRGRGRGGADGRMAGGA